MSPLSHALEILRRVQIFSGLTETELQFLAERDVGHEVGAGSFLVIPAGVVHYIEPLGTEPVMNLDFFLPALEDYMHLVKYLDEDK